MSIKEYNNWHEIKSKLQNDKVRPFFHEREIWFCSIGSNVGFEQDGRGFEFLRPVLILKKFNHQICVIVPLTKTAKQGIHYYSFSYKDSVVSTAILSQIRLIDAKRLEYKDGSISLDNFCFLKEKLKLLIA